MPVSFGSAPVISAVPPGSESDGSAVSASVYSAPPVASRASSEPGWLATYQARSDWCMPSTEIRSTCLIWSSWAPALEVDSAVGTPIANAASAALATLVRGFIFTPFRLACHVTGRIGAACYRDVSVCDAVVNPGGRADRARERDTDRQRHAQHR